MKYEFFEIQEYEKFLNIHEADNMKEIRIEKKTTLKTYRINETSKISDMRRMPISVHRKPAQYQMNNKWGSVVLCASHSLTKCQCC